MNVIDLLPWLNLLLIPSITLLFSINQRLATLEATQLHHGRRLQKLDGIEV